MLRLVKTGEPPPLPGAVARSAVKQGRIFALDVCEAIVCCIVVEQGDTRVLWAWGRVRDLCEGREPNA